MEVGKTGVGEIALMQPRLLRGMLFYMLFDISIGNAER